MPRTDYSQIAGRYDNDPVRHAIPIDEQIKTLAAPSKVLDLGCGTGNYLAAQLAFYPEKQIAWHGLDPSEAMLAKAHAKNLRCDLRVGRAERLPYADAKFDYVVCRYAFHHVEDKAAALSEAHRVLRPGGILRIENIAPDLSPDWWIHRYFPSIRAADLARFWPVTQLESALQQRGFKTRTSTRAMPSIPFQVIYNEALNRTASQFTLIDNAEYESGMKTLAEELKLGGDRMVNPGLLIVNIIAEKSR